MGDLVGAIVPEAAGALVGEENLETLREAQSLLRQLQDVLEGLAKSEDTPLACARAATVAALAMLQNAYAGKLPADYTLEDWRRVAQAAGDYGVNVDGRSYTKFVFSAYAAYIRSWADVLAETAGPERCCAIRAVAGHIDEQTRLLDDGEVTEPAYVDACLWLSLEGMVKLLSAAAATYFGEAGALAGSVAGFGLQYARLAMYTRERDLLQGHLDRQRELDAELAARLAEREAQIEEGSRAFQDLVAHAFDRDVRQALQSSACLALAAGVDETEVLQTMEDVDDFFLG